MTQLHDTPHPSMEMAMKGSEAKDPAGCMLRKARVQADTRGRSAEGARKRAAEACVRPTVRKRKHVAPDGSIRRPCAAVPDPRAMPLMVGSDGLRWNAIGVRRAQAFR